MAYIKRKFFYFILIAYSAFTFIPFLWSLSTSLKPQEEVFQTNILPQSATVRAYGTVFTKIQPSFPSLFANSLFIATVVVILHLIFASLAGYAFARLRFPGRDILFYIVLGTMMIPDQLRLVPIYQLLVKMGLISNQPSNYLAIFLVKAIGAADIFLIRQFFLSIPRDLEDAAKIDGAGPFQTFTRVMLPNAMPVLATVAILTFQGTWNDLFWPSIVLQSPNHWTLPFGILQFKGQFSTDWPPIMALVVLSTLPILAIYAFGQRYIINMQLSSSVKG
ncbi:MAG: carbohydrate ABC transporter permease [Actinobacteria bacterium]|nr:carbohydrate ABC transporter permease [Actinomycetota bacterium]